ncbi:MAG: RNA-binding S4 domain-containing protein [Bacteroidales bacterium]|nr:RNA-binding S4 domain-containing protein [Bacteroidales bacterium]
MENDTVRIDKWLWAVRLYKTRALASEACRAGKVKRDGTPLKASHAAQVGEVYEINVEQLRRVVEVKALPGNRVGAKLVENYLADLTPPEEYERMQLVRQYGFERRDRGLGRPTKKDRRQIEEFKYK